MTARKEPAEANGSQIQTASQENGNQRINVIRTLIPKLVISVAIFHLKVGVCGRTLGVSERCR